MKVLHLNAGNETGGGMFHILSLLNELNRSEFYLGVFEQGEMHERAVNSGIQTVLFHQKSKFDISIIKKIILFINENEIDLVHTHGARANCYGILIHRFADVKWVATVHSDPRDDFMGMGAVGRLYTAANKSALKKADHLLAISDRFKNILTGFGIPSKRVSTILNGIDFDKKLPDPYERKELGLTGEDFVVIMVARLEPVKGHKIALQAMKKVKLAHQGKVRLLLVGDGQQKEVLEKYAAELGLEKVVNFLGHRNDVEKIYPAADLAILTSYSESFPLVLLEAARAGVPVITTDVGGVDKLIPDEKYGWIIPVENPDSLADRITSAMEMKTSGQLRDMGRKLESYSKRHFSIEQFANNVYNVYLKLLN
ncbi:glycosyltransferase family 4 protein [[Bacillus] enclensis]|uniref:glycosyltransferase family 4 protein n=1 Tax=[Bacillus] enclensis TaxID=1402860 RepID=UPI0018DBADA9|nr:glycosyltransferase family 4 protein [[Bacillus] enclensis]MBH9966618.1 glycosyltransferase family 4 protein [[Bacillus] enclensis]